MRKKDSTLRAFITDYEYEASQLVSKDIGPVRVNGISRMDVEALGQLTQSYMRHGLEKEIDLLPRVKGAAVVFDDANERIFPVQMRPRFTWHGGGSPVAIKEKKDEFDKKLKELNI